MNPDVPEGLSAIIMKLMARAPAARYQSAYGAWRDLQQFSGLDVIPPEIVLGASDVMCVPAFDALLHTGREGVFDKLQAAFTAAEAGQPVLLKITGSYGVGKSTIARFVLSMHHRKQGIDFAAASTGTVANAAQTAGSSGSPTLPVAVQGMRGLLRRSSQSSRPRSDDSELMGTEPRTSHDSSPFEDHSSASSVPSASGSDSSCALRASIVCSTVGASSAPFFAVIACLDEALQCLSCFHLNVRQLFYESLHARLGGVLLSLALEQLAQLRAFVPQAPQPVTASTVSALEGLRPEEAQHAVASCLIGVFTSLADVAQPLIVVFDDMQASICLPVCMQCIEPTH